MCTCGNLQFNNFFMVLYHLNTNNEDKKPDYTQPTWAYMSPKVITKRIVAILNKYAQISKYILSNKSSLSNNI